MAAAVGHSTRPDDALQRLASFSGAARVGESAPAGFPFIGSGRTSTWDEITSPWPMQMGGNGVPGRRGTLGHMQVGGR